VIDDDPLGQIWYQCRTGVLLGSGLEDEALNACLQGMELDPEFWLGRMYLGLLYALRGRHDEALACAEETHASAPWSALTIGLLAGVLANVGQAEKAQSVLNTLSDQMPSAPWGRAYYALCRGELDSAVEWMSQAADQRTVGLVTLMVRPFEPILRQSAAWPALLKKLNLTEADR
jgi:tetratricopeptide (TPR) repeat protein